MFSFCYEFNDAFANTSAIWYIQTPFRLIISQYNLHFFFRILHFNDVSNPTFADNYVML